MQPLAEKGNALAIRILSSEPDLPNWLQSTVQAFYRLAPSANMAGRIPFSEIVVYWRAIPLPWTLEEFIRLIQSMESELEHQRKAKEKAKPKPKPPARR